MAQGDELSQTIINLPWWLSLHYWALKPPLSASKCSISALPTDVHSLSFLLGRRKLWGANKWNDCERYKSHLNMSLENMFPQWLSVFYLYIK